MKRDWEQLLLFVVLSIIWGSSFILMKEGLEQLTSFQVASLRIVSSGVVFLPLVVKSCRLIPYKKWPVIFLSGALGSLVPAYLFCTAETGLSSSLAGTLNSLTPIFTIITAALIFKSTSSMQQIVGVLIALVGCLLLFFTQTELSFGHNPLFVVLIIIATLSYGLNANIVFHYLQSIPSLQIVSLALFLNAIPAFVVLLVSGFFSLNFHNQAVLNSIGFSSLLGVLSTSFASILYYRLIKTAGAVFSSMVTYGIPIVAIAWGIVYHENVGWLQICSLIIILAGVYYANRTKKTTSED